MYRSHLTILVFVGFLLVSNFISQPAHTEKSNQDLEKVKEQLERERKSLDDLRTRKGSILDVLDDLGQKIQSNDQENRTLRTQIGNLEKQMKEINEKITGQEKTIQKSRSLVNKRMIALYKMGELGSFKVLFTATSFSELLQRSHGLRFVITRDLRTIESFNRDLQHLVDLQNQFRESQTQLLHSQEKSEKTQANLLNQRQRKKEILTAVENEEDLHQRYIAELEESQEKLEKLLESLSIQKLWKKKGKAVVADRGFPARKGTIMPPVKGKVLQKFGKIRDPKFYTFRFHKGIDLGAPAGETVKAVYDGKVAFSGWFKGFGQLLIIDHGEGYHSLVAHADEILKKVGEEVKEGEALARVSPDWLSQDPQSKKSLSILYFEIREHGHSVDPLEWLAMSELM